MASVEETIITIATTQMKRNENGDPAMVRGG